MEKYKLSKYCKAYYYNLYVKDALKFGVSIDDICGFYESSDIWLYLWKKLLLNNLDALYKENNCIKPIENFKKNDPAVGVYEAPFSDICENCGVAERFHRALGEKCPTQIKDTRYRWLETRFKKKRKGKF